MAARKNPQNTQQRNKAQAAPTSDDAEQKAADEQKAAEEQAAAEAEQNAAKSESDAGEPTPVLMIRSTRKGGHRRAGFRWTREPVGIEAAALSDEQREQLEDDPNIVMEEGEADL